MKYTDHNGIIANKKRIDRYRRYKKPVTAFCLGKSVKPTNTEKDITPTTWQIELAFRLSSTRGTC